VRDGALIFVLTSVRATAWNPSVEAMVIEIQALNVRHYTAGTLAAGRWLENSPTKHRRLTEEHISLFKRSSAARRRGRWMAHSHYVFPRGPMNNSSFYNFDQVNYFFAELIDRCIGTCYILGGDEEQARVYGNVAWI